ncbi:unnamed protein product [Phyllotreta striolata]|uniref:Uncharacterized protein n=1 Tax=Phyllotreta striolata TaxID=444603 RepID=A0A9N9TQP6_PHYSR|nr:unnamed protein product [Phyllotreta striolata]
MSSSSNISRTNSQIDRIEQGVKLLKEEQAKREAQLLEQREIKFRKISREKSDPVFSLPGLRFYYFTHRKIKFAIFPCYLSDAFSRRREYVCRLVYKRKMGRWWVRTNAFPLPCLGKINATMYKKVGDDGIVDGIKEIYRIADDWIAKEEKRILKKYNDFANNEIDATELRSSEEELFFDDD